MAIQFIHKPKGSTIGSGDYVFRHFGSELVTYTITPTFTNVTGSPLTASVQSGGSQTFTLSADGTSYKLPTSITVGGTTVGDGSIITIPNVCTVLFGSSSSIGGSISFSNVIDDVAFSVAGEQLIVPIKSSLEEYTWAEIKQLSQALVAGTLTQYQLNYIYNIFIGSDIQPDSTKISTINGETHSYRLVGLLHDVDANGNAIGMTFEQVDLMTNTYAFKSSASDTDNWGNSDLIATINNFTIASDLSAVITAAKKECAANVTTGTPKYYQTSALWIMSETEIANSQSNTIDNTVEGSPYEYYSNTGYNPLNRRKSDSGKYWLRSPIAYSDTNSFFAVINNKYGTTAMSRNTSSNGVAPCFCV